MIDNQHLNGNYEMSFNHFTYHRGQLVTLLRQAGLQIFRP
ncbi:DinB family protein [Chitinophaga sancti]